MAKNQVVAGDYEGGKVVFSAGQVTIAGVVVSKRTISRYETVERKVTKSAAGTVGRFVLGASLFGAIGGYFVARGAKKKRTHTLSIYFKDGKTSLIEVDDRIYKVISAVIF